MNTRITKQRIVTGLFAGLAAMSTFFAAPQKAHANYSLPVPSSQTMKYRDSDGIGKLGIYNDGWDSYRHCYDIEVELYQNGCDFCGYGYRFREYNPTCASDCACDHVIFVICDDYGDEFEFDGYIYYNSYGDISGDGDYGFYGDSLTHWWEVYN